MQEWFLQGLLLQLLLPIEEGVRYSPDMMGSLVYAGGMDVEDALDAVGTDGTVLRDELKRIGYEGTVELDLLNHMHLWNCTLNRDRSLTMRAFASAQ